MNIIDHDRPVVSNNALINKNEVIRKDILVKANNFTPRHYTGRAYRASSEQTNVPLYLIGDETDD